MITHWKGDPPTAPYYAVIFISQKSEQLDGYAEADAEMMSEAQKQEGYLGYSSSGEPKQGIFISYWQDQESIQKWRAIFLVIHNILNTRDALFETFLHKKNGFNIREFTLKKREVLSNNEVMVKSRVFTKLLIGIDTGTKLICVINDNETIGKIVSNFLKSL